MAKKPPAVTLTLSLENAKFLALTLEAAASRARAENKNPLAFDIGTLLELLDRAIETASRR